jgi:signal transduction histidine kinase/phage shock protein PspC (stress-responsive transcriptional regulator)
VVLGVAAALAGIGDVDPVAVRLGFVVLTVAAGAGIPLYGLGWLLLVWRQAPPSRPQPSRRGEVRRTVAVALIVAGVLLVVQARIGGVVDQLVWPAGIVGLGLALLWPRLDLTGDDQSASNAVARILGAVLLVASGLGAILATNLSVEAVRDGLAATAFILAGTLLLFAPSLHRLIASAGEERRQRIRADERAELAAHLHDSVLQTLTLIQKRADDPLAMSAIARHQERELRRWLYEPATVLDAATFRGALDAAVAEVEDQHLVTIENVTVGDAPLDVQLSAGIAAAREALVNAAKFSGTRSIALYARVTDTACELFVRDRGVGFELGEVPADRHGIRESIVARVTRAQGGAEVRTSPGAGTEVRLRLPRVAR